MTTKDSPPAVLRSQAAAIAANLKRASRGEYVAADPAGKIARSRALGVVKLGVVMDDKAITIEIGWDVIDKSSCDELTEYMFNLMAEKRETVQ